MNAALVKRDAPDSLLSDPKRQRTQQNAVVAVSSSGKQAPATAPRTSALAAPILRLEGHKGELFACRFSPDGEVLATAGMDRDVRLWRTFDADVENFALMSGHSHAVLGLDWSHDASRLVTASVDKSARFWDSARCVQVKKMREHSDVVTSAAMLQSGPSMAVTGSEDGMIKVWDQRAKRSAQTLASGYQVFSVCFNTTGDEVFSSGLDNAIKVWDLRKEAVSLELAGHGGSVTGVALSPDGHFLLSNGMDNTLRVWDIRPYAPAHRCVHVLSGHTHAVEKHLLRCAWSGDGCRITAGSGDRAVYVWRLRGRTLEYALPGHTGSVNEVAFAGKEPVLASVASDGDIFLGEIAPVEE